MLYVCVSGVMDVRFSFCIVTRGAVACVLVLRWCVCVCCM